MMIEKAREKILSEMLERLPEDYDKSEGGLFYDNLAPISIEMEEERDVQAYIFKNSFAETAEGIYLDYIVKEVGIARKQATKSKGFVTIKGQVGTTVPLGTQVASDSYIYVITREGIIGEEGTITLPIESQDPGATYNVPAGTITNFPITVKGLQEVINNLGTTDGFNAEEDNALRERYYFKVQNPITSGNEFHYKKWCNEVEGVGNTKVFSLWNGAGTVKCVITDKSYTVAPEELLERVRTYVESVRPIGATVTIASAKEKAIDIRVDILLASNVNLNDVVKAYRIVVSEYLREIGFISNYVSYAKIGNILLNVPGVLDYKDLRVNLGVVNIPLGVEEIPKLNNVDLSEVK